MFKTIIADDELCICMLLQKLVDWKNMDIELIGQYLDGAAAMEAIRTTHPDIVIADIRMPKLSGLDIVRMCKEESINCHFLLISGHAEFEYAHMALKYDVENYLLKPINKNELENNLRQIIHNLKNEKRTREKQINLENKLRMNQNILRQQFLNNLITLPQWFNEQSAQRILSDYSLDFPESVLSRIVSIQCISKGDFNDRQYQHLLKLMEGYLNKNANRIFSESICTIIDRRIYLLILYKDVSAFTTKLQGLFEEIKTRFFEYCDICAGVSSEISNLSSFSNQIGHQLNAALQYRFNGGVNKIYFYEKLPNCPVELPISKLVKAFDSYLETFQSSKIEPLFSQLQDMAAPNNLNLNSLMQLMSEFKAHFVSYARKQHLIESEIAQIESDMRSIAENSKNKKRMITGLEVLICDWMNRINVSQTAEQSRHIRIAKDYVNNHLQENISLNDVSNVIFMNPTYFSSLFKKTTGQNFSDYLITKRIDRAKELLKDLSISIAEVGERVGYPNARYFSKVFLKQVGIKPSEYRKLNIT